MRFLKHFPTFFNPSCVSSIHIYYRGTSAISLAKPVKSVNFQQVVGCVQCYIYFLIIPTACAGSVLKMISVMYSQKPLVNIGGDLSSYCDHPTKFHSLLASMIPKLK